MLSVSLAGAGLAAQQQTLADLPGPAQHVISSAIGQDQSAYHAASAAAGATLANQANGFTAQLRSGALQISAGANTWTMSLVGLSYGGATQELGAPQTTVGTPQTTVNGSQVDCNYGTIDEWYVNGPSGLEQGFNVTPPQSGPGGSLTVALALGGNLMATVNGAGNGLTLATPDGSTVLGYNGLVAYDATGKTLPASLEVQTIGGSQELLIHVNDAGAHGPITIDPFVQDAKLTASDGAAGDDFGSSVAISGNTIVVGVPNANTVYVFTEPASGWADMTQIAKLTESSGGVSDEFGYSVAISGNTVVATAPNAAGSNGRSGAAYVFTMPASGWTNMTQTAALAPSDGATGPSFGQSVSISGNTVVVGATGTANAGFPNSGPGAAYVFTQPGSGWAGLVSQTATLTTSAGVEGDQFGQSVSISGSTIVVGALETTVGSNSGQGAAYVFTEPGSAWASETQTAELTASDGAANDVFGYSVSISGATVVVGATGANGSHGVAYVFTQPAGGWASENTATAKLTDSTAAAGGNFGFSVSISNSIVVVAAPNATVGANGNQGAAYEFAEPSSGWTNMNNPTATLTASDGAANNDYGSSISISGNTVVVGADTADAGQGAAYVSQSASPYVAGVAPAAGPVAGGTSVTITGSGFTGATAVRFGTAAASSFVVNSVTQITAVAPAEAAGSVDVTVTTSLATSTTSPADQFTYLAAPAVTRLSPVVGPLSGGTSVTITGTNFTAATVVDFGTIAATIISETATQIVATSPVEAAGTVAVTVTGPGGASGTSPADRFTYAAVPFIAGVIPAAGALAGGTSVTITGTGFSGATVIDFGSAAGTITSDSATQIVATSPAGTAGTVDVTVVAPGGTSVTSPADQFTYMTAPVVTGIGPIIGPVTGGTVVTIAGTGFTDATVVDFGTVAASSFLVDSATQITATSPVESAGTVDVTVIGPGGTSATLPADQFTYLTAPTVQTISPAGGPIAGGTLVTITGASLTGVSVVDFGTIAATNVVDVSATEVTAISPAESAGTVNVTMTGPVGTSGTSLADQFTYAAGPLVAGVGPAVGPLAGGTSVTITGTGFTGASVVDFGTVAGTITSVTATQIVVTSPAGTAGTVPVSVVAPGGTSPTSPADQFTYVAAPVVTGIGPVAGQMVGGTPVMITGAGFTGATVVDFGASAASNLVVISATQIMVTSPAGAGLVDVTVAGPGGTSATSPADQFTYLMAPTVQTISPAAGPIAGGTLVTITGASLTGTTVVDFGTVAAPYFVVVSVTEITAISPAQSAGTVDVTVTGPAGASGTSPADRFTYAAAPVVTGVSPALGPLAGGTPVTITGTGFTAATIVDFGTTAGTITSDTATQIVATSPAGTAGAVAVTVVTPSGTSPTSPADQFTYFAAPVVTGIGPAVGQMAGGTPVTITGTGFTDATIVDFGASAASNLVIVSATQIMVTSPAGAGVVDVTVTGPGGISATSPADQFTYLTAPTVQTIGPAAGPLAGGTQVTITGASFMGTTVVDFGTIAATNVVVVSATEITAISPVESAGTVNVTVTGPGGTSGTSPADQFTYTPAPVVAGVSPAVGPLAGATPVTITGTGFTAATIVDFGTTAGTITSDTATQIVATSPAGTAGTVAVTVVTPGGTSATSPADQFTYLAPPVVTGVGPVIGPLTGGTMVTITGAGFTDATVVDFGTIAAANIVLVSATQITANSPAELAGTVDVTVTGPGGVSATSPADQFTYLTVPAVQTISPATGPLNGGTQVTITGTSFTAATVVDFGTVPAINVVVVSATQITAISPAESAGVVNVTVTGPVGTSGTSPADQFTYVAAPTVTGVSPAKGPSAGGTTVTITGTGFTGATVVDFGAAAAAITSDTATQIVATAPTGTSGTVPVSVVTPGGISAASPADQFTYLAAPTVTGVSPAAGPLAGGTLVTITGASFNSATVVDFGAVAATNIVVLSATQITAISPAESVGTVDVTVTALGGVSATSPADQFSYGTIATVQTISPAAGPLEGGTLVTITGAGFTGTTAVDFGQTPASSFLVVSPTEITATSPAESAGPVYVTVTGPGGISGTSSADQFTYMAAPLVASVNPTAGPLAGGTSVTITGTGFTSATVVDFGTTAATISSDTATQIVATSPAGTAGTVAVTVVTPGGTSPTLPADQFTYVAAPLVTGIGPVAGAVAGGTLVTITGAGFTAATVVDFGASAASNLVVVSATEITVTSPAGAGVVDVTVTGPGGISATSPADQFTYLMAPTVQTISPAAGPIDGGTLVTITGASFTDATVVDFGTIAAPYFVVVSATQITAINPAESAGTVTVTVTGPAGVSGASPADQFTYVAAPTVQTISPVAGPLNGGTQVTITGTGFTGAPVVHFGTAAASSVTVLSATQILAVAPAEAAGTVDVTVTGPGGVSTTSSADQFTYLAAPAVTGVSPAVGPLGGGTQVMITGTSFTDATVVDFGTIAATNVVVVSATQITVTSPAELAGTVDITVTGPGGTSGTSSADQFTYLTVPTVAAISPAAGPLNGGTLVTITGASFTAATVVDFGTIAATQVVVVSATEITAVSPAESAGTVDITVTGPIGPSATSPADQFTYLPAPTVTGVSPVAGPLAGGTSVTITGTGFTAATVVDFGAVAATITSVTATQIVATDPAEPAGTVAVTAITLGGTSATSPADQFTYLAAPAVTGVSPSAGSLAGGTLVTITGTSFTDATLVDFGAVAATNIVIVSATQIIATGPPESAGTVDVIVTGPGGVSTTSPADQFTFMVAPTVTGISPSAGPATGGTLVTITGTTFTGAPVVDFGTIAATNVVVVSATEITAVSPAESVNVVDVTVIAPGGPSATSPADQFSYAPVVTGISPNVGPLTGGTSVTITGAGFTAATVVDFGGAAAAIISVTATQIVAMSPAESAGPVDIPVDVTVTTPGGTSATSPADQFTYLAAPALTGISPAAGPATGGTLVTITGTSLAYATAVDFGSTPVTIVSDTATQISVTSPAGAGVGEVTVTTPGGTSGASSANQFTYVPVVTGISAYGGLATGGTLVTITGAGFTNSSAVDFGTIPATDVVVVSTTQITATSPAEGAGTVDVTVTASGNTSATSSADQFSYSPVLTGISPAAGPVEGGMSVTITGAGFASATAVYFGTVPAPSFTFNPATQQIFATSPAEAAGTVDVTVVAGGQTSATSLADQYAYLTAATVVPGGVSTVVGAGTYRAGTQIPITVAFDEEVWVTGSPQLTLNAGSGAEATYTSGSGTTVLTFTFTVAVGQSSPDLDYTSTTALGITGTIEDSAGIAAVLTLSAPATLGDELAPQNIVIDSSPPTVATAASATPHPVMGMTVNLSVLGADVDTGPGSLTYQWQATTVPNGAGTPTFSANDSNAARNSTATFTSAGAYVFSVTITDPEGLTATSSVNVTVNQTLTTIIVSPSTVNIQLQTTQQFSATGYDQFGGQLLTQPKWTWTTTTGTITTGGFLTDSSGTAGMVTATSGLFRGTANFTASPAEIVPDPILPGSLTDLYVFGTTGNDTILVNPGTVAGTVTVTMNSVLIGTFSPTGRIIIYGRSGAGTSDSIGVSSQITLPAWIYGDAGTDVLWGGGGPNIEIAGTGTDTLYGGLGRNILISGSGSDELVGGSGDGLLIGGTTSYNANDMALQAIMNEWNSSDSYATRVSHVTGKAGGLNGSYYFDAATVSGGGADTLVAGNANDVFFQALGDTVLNRRASETLVSVP
jgi:hypothetical protein